MPASMRKALSAFIPMGKAVLRVHTRAQPSCQRSAGGMLPRRNDLRAPLHPEMRLSGISVHGTASISTFGGSEIPRIR